VRELLILRHGKSDWSQATDDFKRPLKERGKRDAQRMGLWLAQQDWVPDYILASPASRAITTAQKLCKTIGIYTQQIKQESRIYAADNMTLLAVLADCPAKARRVLLVGHNPGLEELLQYLAEQKIPLPTDGKLLPTATLARLLMPDDWSALPAGCAQMDSITRPHGLPKQFPYPDWQGKELRDRPAYYYTQASVIPYRIQDGKPQILVIMSNQKKHWGVPKGISDPGQTLQESAAQEALEEAGAKGEVGTLPLGSYTYKKWGAKCLVHVYPMAVSHLLPESAWQESHREREWLSPQQAIERIKHKQLRPMIKALVKQLQKDL
jgi:phosphohistidine phosphatase